MNILVTVNSYYPKLDGVQAVTDYLTKGLAARGHQITIVTPISGNLTKEEGYGDIKILRVDIHTKFCIYHGDRKAYRKFIIGLSKKNDVMINVCTQNALTDLLFPVLDQIKCKKVLHIHGINKFSWDKADFADLKHFSYKIWKNFRWGCLYKFNGNAIKQYDAVLQLHKFDSGYSFFEKHYGVKSHILENACDRRFGEIENVQKEKYCVSVANYTVRKNQEFLIKAFYQAAIPNDWKLVLIGGEKNAYYEKLEQLARNLEQQYGHRNIEMYVGVSRDRTIDLVKRASIYLLGSTWEAFSISIIEAMAAADPFISTNTGVTRFMPGGVVIEDTAGMAYWIENFIKDKDIRGSYGKAGHDYYEKHLTTQSKVDDLNELLMGLVHGR